VKVHQTGLFLLAAFVLVASGLLPVAAANETIQVTDRSRFAPTVPNKAPSPANAQPGMVWIPGGEFSMGCEVPSESVCTMATMNAVNDAQPIHRVYVDDFWMDRTDVTNEEFAKFVDATGYIKAFPSIGRA
jgi:formylglycine-generating enzyme required for sulfatase activity